MKLPFYLDIPERLPLTEIVSDVTLAKSVQLQVLRLDLIHPQVSGNKLYKLFYFLQHAIAENLPLITFGGAYSNHLAATAFACRELGMTCHGIVRGEAPEAYSETLQFCAAQGMNLHFISRENYREISTSGDISSIFSDSHRYLIVPEGGYAPDGAAGAALIMNDPACKNATHVATATGTATTLAGLVAAAADDQQIISVPVIKQMEDIPQRLDHLLKGKKYKLPEVFGEFHFGGYAKKTNELIAFMNQLYKEHEIPTDIVYTSKMMYAVIKKIEAGYFPPGSNILALHTGGLQGNASLAPGTLIF